MNGIAIWPFIMPTAAFHRLLSGCELEEVRRYQRLPHPTPVSAERTLGHLLPRSPLPDPERVPVVAPESGVIAQGQGQ